jgi:hypothetical protein
MLNSPTITSPFGQVLVSLLVTCTVSRVGSTAAAVAGTASAAMNGTSISKRRICAPFRLDGPPRVRSRDDGSAKAG